MRTVTLTWLFQCLSMLPAQRLLPVFSGALAVTGNETVGPAVERYAPRFDVMQLVVIAKDEFANVR